MSPLQAQTISEGFYETFSIFFQSMLDEGVEIIAANSAIDKVDRRCSAVVPSLADVESSFTTMFASLMFSLPFPLCVYYLLDFRK